MASNTKALSVLKALGQVLAALAFALCLLLFRPLSWAIALLVVILTIAALVSSLSMWPAAACFAALVGLHLFIAAYPIESLERRFGLQKKDRA